MSTPAQNPSSSPIPNTTDVDYRVLQSVDSYAEAQELVDRLSDGGFPVEKVRIVGTGLRLVEQVVGRLTIGKAAGLGALQGVWFGLMVGILLGIFSAPGAWLWTLLIGAGIGAVWGAIFGALSHAATGGRRDFASLSTIEAASYDVLVEATHVAEAAQVVNGTQRPAEQN